MRIDRALTARLLGFRAPIHNVLYAGNARGKCESVVLSAAAQVMITLSRLAEDLILFTMPEFGYFSLPAEYCTGSSIMPQKKNPDVLELIRARTSEVIAAANAAATIVKGLPSGYNRDLQETKAGFIEGLRVTRASLRIMALLVDKLRVDRDALARGFRPEVFAADKALELVSGGMSFRNAYDHVRDHLGELTQSDPRAALLVKRHLGAPNGIDFTHLARRASEAKAHAVRERRRFHGAIGKLLGVGYPGLS